MLNYNKQKKNRLLTFQFGPNIIGVKELERFHRFKVVHVLGRNLSNFQQSQFVLVLNECATLNVGPRLIRHLHNELNGMLRAGTQQFIQNVEINGGAQIINVR